MEEVHTWNVRGSSEADNELGEDVGVHVGGPDDKPVGREEVVNAGIELLGGGVELVRPGGDLLGLPHDHPAEKKMAKPVFVQR